MHRRHRNRSPTIQAYQKGLSLQRGTSATSSLGSLHKFMKTTNLGTGDGLPYDRSTICPHH